jgi:hypothetical protein
MKTPLRYQITEFDCGSVSLINCIVFLFEREEIPAELIKAISTYTLDCYDEFGNLGQKGTSREAVKYLSRWIVDFCNKKDLKLSCKYLSGKNVNFEKIKQCLDNKGCVNLRTYQNCEHYVTITGYDNKYVYIFDPYYTEKHDYDDDPFIEPITNKPFQFNKKVKIERFTMETKDEMALGPIPKREVVIINRK